MLPFLDKDIASYSYTCTCNSVGHKDTASQDNTNWSIRKDGEI